MTDIILGIGVATFIVYTGFYISYIRSMKQTGERMGGFIQRAEGSLNGALAELTDTLKNMKKITGNVGAVSEDVRRISNSVVNVEKSIRFLYEYVRESLGPAAGANMAGLKAGITTGVTTLVRSFKEGRSDDHEGRT
jgi:uncharacterized protein YoxC